MDVALGYESHDAAALVVAAVARARGDVGVQGDISLVGRVAGIAEDDNVTVVDRVDLGVDLQGTDPNRPVHAVGVDLIVDHTQKIGVVPHQRCAGSDLGTDTVRIDIEGPGRVHGGIEHAVLDHLDHDAVGGKMHRAGLRAGANPEVLGGNINARFAHLRPGRIGGGNGQVDRPPRGFRGIRVDFPLPGHNRELLHVIGELQNFPAAFDHIRLRRGVQTTAAHLVVVDDDDVIYRKTTYFCVHLDTGDVLQDDLVEITVAVVEEDDAVRAGRRIATEGEGRGAGTAGIDYLHCAFGGIRDIEGIRPRPQDQLGHRRPADAQFFIGGEHRDKILGDRNLQVIGHGAEVEDRIPFHIAEAVGAETGFEVIGICAFHSAQRVGSGTAGDLVRECAAGDPVVPIVAVELIGT